MQPSISLCVASIACIIAGLTVSMASDSIAAPQSNASNKPAKAPPTPTAVIGHRGSAMHYPENTLRSVQAALDAGAQFVEIDLLMSSDGVVVLMHDKTLDRTTPAKGPVNAMTAAQLTQLDAGAWKDPKFAGERVPSFAAAAKLIGDRATMVLDLKRAGMGKGIARDLAAAGIDPAQVAIGAWNDEQLADAVKHNPRANMIHIGSAPKKPAEYDAWLKKMAAKGYRGLSLNFKTVTDDLVAKAHAMKLPVYVWTLNDPPAFDAAIRLGVDGIITDDPAGLAKHLAK